MLNRMSESDLNRLVILRPLTEAEEQANMGYMVAERGPNNEVPLTRTIGVKQTFGDASILKNSPVVFNISGTKFRLVGRINYPYRIVYVRFVGTHEEYDNIDAETI
jgi:hypothetical protein